MDKEISPLEISEQIHHINYLNGDVLNNIYDQASYDKENLRYKELLMKFENVLYPGFSPVAIARAPGRVNLIGEHIDYEGFAVLPMAIENDILIAIKCTYSQENDPNTINTINLHINHFNSDKYKPYFLIINPRENSSFISPHDWVNYLIAGFNAIINFIKEKDLKLDKSIKDIRLLITGNVPPAAGLSSSSALTVCSALAFTKVFNISDKISKNELAHATINYERKVGTACGGMDQTISIYAEKDQAKLIRFHPSLSTCTVNLPKGVSFLIANSLTDSTKVETLAFRYNKRVVENKIGLAIISNKLKLDKVYSTTIEIKSALNLDYKQLEEVIRNNLKDTPYSIKDINLELNPDSEKPEYSLDSILSKIPHFKEVLAKNNEFKIKNRLLHVCKEAERVEKFYEVCSLDINEEEKIIQLGSLMSNSHTSCKDLYECSSTQLDALVDYCNENKAVGARMTGAGWGGCCVIMIRNEDLEYLKQKLYHYYERFSNVNKDVEFFFVTKASQGACIINI